MICELDIIRAFEFFIKEVEENKKGRFFYVTDSYGEKQILRFIEEDIIDKNIGYNWLFDYFCYQFQRVLSQKTHSARVREGILLSMVIGKASVEKWYLKNKHWKYFIDINLLRIYPNITFKKFKAYLVRRDKKISTDYISLNPNEEKSKELATNHTLRFIICLETTTLFNNNSPICQGCSVNVECKYLLKINLPTIYAARGY